MTMARSDAVHIALLSAATISACIANHLMHVSISYMAFTLIGIGAYAALVQLGDYDPQLICDTIQSGETAVGTFALFTAVLFITANPYLILAFSFIALLAYQLYMKGVLAPVKKEIALSGTAAQVILAVIALFLITGGAGRQIPHAGSVFTGYFAAIGLPAAIPAAAVVLALIIPILFRGLSPEMRLFSQGASFSPGSRRTRTGAAIGLVIARSLLVMVSLLFSGWTCAIGISVRRLYRGAMPNLIMVLSLLCLGQTAVLIESLSGPLQAAAFSWACSYALFFLYYCRRVHVYDRYQQT